MKKDAYFQFPLCALAFGKSATERLNAIISYGMIETGKVFWPRYSDAKRRELLLHWADELEMDVDLLLENELHCAILCGAHVLQITPGPIQNIIKSCEQLRQFVTEFEIRHGKDTSVRLKQKLVFEARDGSGITPLELSILAAIYSTIGDKHHPVRITQERIRCRALGYKSKVVFDSEFPHRKDKQEPLSQWRLRNTVKKLHARKFFRRTTFGRRETYYSHRMTETEFRQAIFNKKTHKDLFLLSQRLADDELTNAIRNQRAATRGEAPWVPHARPRAVKTAGFE